MAERLMTPEEAAYRLAVSPKSVREWLRQGKLGGVRAGRLWRVRERDLDRFLTMGRSPEVERDVPVEDVSLRQYTHKEIRAFLEADKISPDIARILPAPDSSQDSCPGNADYTGYLEAWRKRVATEEWEVDRLKEEATAAAAEMATRIGRRFLVKRIYLFGSLVSGGFRRDSDIDLAVEGLAPQEYWSALGCVEDTKGFDVDLVAMETAAPTLRERIMAEGRLLYDRG